MFHITPIYAKLRHRSPVCSYWSVAFPCLHVLSCDNIFPAHANCFHCALLLVYSSLCISKHTHLYIQRELLKLKPTYLSLLFGSQHILHIRIYSPVTYLLLTAGPPLLTCPHYSCSFNSHLLVSWFCLPLPGSSVW